MELLEQDFLTLFCRTAVQDTARSGGGSLLVGHMFCNYVSLSKVAA